MRYVLSKRVAESVAVENFGGINGAELLALTRDDLIELCGHAARGMLLFNGLHGVSPAASAVSTGAKRKQTAGAGGVHYGAKRLARATESEAGAAVPVIELPASPAAAESVASATDAAKEDGTVTITCAPGSLPRHLQEWMHKRPQTPLLVKVTAGKAVLGNTIVVERDNTRIVGAGSTCTCFVLDPPSGRPKPMFVLRGTHTSLEQLSVDVSRADKPGKEDGAAAVEIEGHHVTVADVTIRGSVKIAALNGVNVDTRCDGVALRRLAVSGGCIGCYIGDEAQCDLSKCTLTDIGDNGVVAAAHSHVSLTDCRLERIGTTGIWLWNSGRMSDTEPTRIVGCSVDMCGMVERRGDPMRPGCSSVGIWAASFGPVTISDCTLTNSSYRGKEGAVVLDFPTTLYQTETGSAKPPPKNERPKITVEGCRIGEGNDIGTTLVGPVSALVKNCDYSGAKVAIRTNDTHAILNNVKQPRFHNTFSQRPARSRRKR